MKRLVHLQDAAQIEIVTMADVPAPRKKRAWLAAMRRACDASQVIARKDDFAAGIMTSCQLSQAQISIITADAQSIAHTGTGRHHGALHVCTALAGSLSIHSDGSQVHLLPGQVAMFDSTRPFRLIMHERFRMVLVRLAHRAIGLSPGHTAALAASRWEGTSGVGAVASNLFTTLGSHLSELDSSAADPLGGSIRAMIMSMCAERLRHSAARTPGVRQMLMIRIQSWASEHLHDVSLTPGALAQRHNVSLRYLQLLFADQGTSPARWIRDQRLARCHEDLRNPCYDHLTVAAIGERWGLYGGASQLSRLFRERYGYPPSEVRRQLFPAPGLPAPVLAR